MRKTAALTAITLFAGMIGPALADDDNNACRSEHARQPISIDKMTNQIDKLGYDVRRLKTDDGCFKAQIIDRESGGVVEATFSRTNGELTRASPAF